MSTETHRFTVPEISCEHCVRAIEHELSPIEGVDEVTVDVAAKTVIVRGGSATAIEAAIARAGYAVA